MAAQRGLSHINLLPKTSFEFSSLGKILKWTTTVGRVLVVMTEFVVILAFASRFYFDKKLNDLNEEIDGKLAVIHGYAEVESSMREVLTRQSIITGGMAKASDVERVTANLGRMIPVGVTLDVLGIDGKSVDISGAAGSEALFAQTLGNFKKSPEVSKVSLNKTTYDQSKGTVIFNINVIYK